jgi:hypothetical protein
MIKFITNFFTKHKENKKISLLGYFVIHKITLPIINNTVYSHASVEDVKLLMTQLPDMKINSVEHKDYDFIFELTNVNDSILETAFIIDEDQLNTINDMFNILIDIALPKKEEASKSSDNIVYVNFKK